MRKLLSNNSSARGRLARLAVSILTLVAAIASGADEMESGEGPSDPRGFLYGKVTTESGSTYQGRLRWGDEEAFWGDFFDSVKQERPHREDQQRNKREPFKIFGIEIKRDGWLPDNRGVVARFGDISKIDEVRGDEAILTLKNGSEIAIDGGSDIGRKITVWDPEIGKIEIRWRNVEAVEFLPTPEDLDVDVGRLYGTVETNVGEFEGFVQWDRDECLTTDKLDGDTRDGEVSIDMGNIRSIEKRTRSSSRVVLASGRELVLDGSNDVDDDNRGIFVEDPRFGRVLIDWDAFERLAFSRPGSSGPSYEEFEPGKSLRGRVTTTGGDTHSGALVYDLDEGETWELLSGESRQIEYHIPFARIAEVAPNGSHHSRVVLTGGEELELGDSADVDEDNDGLLIDPGDGLESVYVPWEEVERVEFVH